MAVAAPPPGTCCKCLQPLGVRALRISGKYYHGDCFVCTGCSKKLSDRCHDHEGQPFCRDCYLDKFCEKCSECKKPLEGMVCLEMLGRKYHQQCPKCTMCRKSLAGGQFFPFKGVAYCLDCHWKARHEAQQQQDPKQAQKPPPPQPSSSDTQNQESKNRSRRVESKKM